MTEEESVNELTLSKHHTVERYFNDLSSEERFTLIETYETYFAKDILSARYSREEPFIIRPRLPLLRSGEFIVSWLAVLLIVALSSPRFQPSPALLPHLPGLVAGFVFLGVVGLEVWFFLLRHRIAYYIAWIWRDLIENQEGVVTDLT